LERAIRETHRPIGAARRKRTVAIVRLSERHSATAANEERVMQKNVTELKLEEVKTVTGGVKSATLTASTTTIYKPAVVAKPVLVTAISPMH
jgi:hypothetical protein